MIVSDSGTTVPADSGADPFGFGRDPNVVPTIAAAYDRTTYPGTAYFQSNPDRLATIGRLHGLTTAPPDACRVLEVGCAGGDNLIPMAYQFPGSTFVGVDLSPHQCASARRTIERLGLTNIEIVAGDLRTLNSLEEFDYIVAHGFYSWVPVEVQETLFALCSRHLSPVGIVYVSYNALPGWSSFAVVRAAMRFHTRHFAEDDPARVDSARQVITSIAKGSLSNDVDGMWGESLRRYNEAIRWHEAHLVDEPDAILMHDEMAECNEPVYLQDFVRRARRHGLDYLGDADYPESVTDSLPVGVREELASYSDDIVEYEQYADFFTNRTFRRTLLCRRDTVRESRPMPHLDTLFVSSAMQLASNAEVAEMGEIRFITSRGGECITGDPVLRTAYSHLVELYPAAVAFQDLVAEVNAIAPCDPAVLAADLLYAHTLDSEMVTLRASPVPCDNVLHERPIASALAIHQAKSGQRAVINQRHERIALDGWTAQVLATLAGTRNAEQLDAALQETGGSSLHRVQEALETLRRAALLVR